MPKTKKIDYPNISINEAIQAATALVEKLHGETKNPDAFATLLSHKTGKSGTFLVKLGELRKYGLIEGRGDIKATALAKKIVHPISSQEKQESVNKMIMNVELWRLLNQKIGKDYPSDDQFWVYIMEVLNCDRNEAIREADKIRKKYKEVMSHYTSGTGEGSPKTDSSAEEANEQNNDNKPKVPTGVKMIEAKSGNVYIILPQDKRSIEIAKKLIDILSMQIDQNETDING